MDLPQGLYTIIGRFIVDICDKEQIRINSFNKIERNFINQILSEYPEIDIELISSLFAKIVNNKSIGNLKKLYEEEKINNEKHINHVIVTKHLEKYRDIITAFNSLTVNNINSIILSIWNKNHDIEECIDLYLKIGYVEYQNCCNNEEFLIAYISSFIEFLKARAYSENRAIQIIFSKFEELEIEENELWRFEHGFWEYLNKCENENKEKDYKSWLRQSIIDFYPFNQENCNKLVNYILVNDFHNINKEKDISLIKTTEVSECADGFFSFPNYYEINTDHEYRYNDTADYFELAYYYSYLINKLTDRKPYSIFLITVFYKWLKVNITQIKIFLPELSEEDINKYLWKYSIWKFQFETPINVSEIPFILRGMSKESNTIVELMYDLAEERLITKEELLELWFYFIITEQLSYTNGKLIENYIPLNTRKESYPINGKFELPWYYVRHVDGKSFFYHPHHERGEMGYLPYAYSIDIAKRDFHKLNDYVLWNFPPILCEAVDGKIIKIDEDFASKVISAINSFYSVYERRKNYNVNIDRLTCKDILAIFKNECQLFLNQYQLEDFPLIKIKELYVNSSENFIDEIGIIFTISETEDTITIVYENTSLDRATYLFIVRKEDYDNILKKLIIFWASKEVNKRLKLRKSPEIFMNMNGFLRIVRIIHDDIEEWKKKIKFYSKSNSNTI